MRYTVERLRADVMARLGEIPRLQGQVSASTVPWPEDIIGLKAGALLADVGGKLIEEASSWQLAGGSEVSEAEVCHRLMPCGLYAAEVRLPGGFLRLASVKMPGWRGNVESLIGPDKCDWNRQWSEHMGIAGCPEWPRAYLDSDGDGLLLRLVGSVSDEDSLEWLKVWIVPDVNDSGEFDFPELLYAELVGRIVLSLKS